MGVIEARVDFLATQTGLSIEYLTDMITKYPCSNQRKFKVGMRFGTVVVIKRDEKLVWVKSLLTELEHCFDVQKGRKGEYIVINDDALFTLGMYQELKDNPGHREIKDLEFLCLLQHTSFYCYRFHLSGVSCLYQHELPATNGELRKSIMSENNKIELLSNATGIPVEMLTEEWNDSVWNGCDFEKCAKFIRNLYDFVQQCFLK